LKKSNKLVIKSEDLSSLINENEDLTLYIFDENENAGFRVIRYHKNRKSVNDRSK